MSEDEFYLLAASMAQFGGGFVAAIGEAMYRADMQNKARIAAAFPEFVVTYGPGSTFYESMRLKVYGQ